jgi:hypothetical protein
MISFPKGSSLKITKEQAPKSVLALGCVFKRAAMYSRSASIRGPRSPFPPGDSSAL